MNAEHVKKIVLMKTQLGIFFKSPIARPDLLTRKVSDEFKQYFDSAPINLPIPPDILDFPVAQLKSSNNKWQASVSRLRADVIFIPEDGKTYGDIESELEEMEKMLICFFEEANQQKIEINRITNISNFAKITESAIEELQKLYLKKENKDISELTIRFNEPITTKFLTCNNIIQYEAAQVMDSKDGTEKMGILILRDFNTDPRKNDTLTIDQVKTFIEIAHEYSHNPNIE